MEPPLVAVRPLSGSLDFSIEMKTNDKGSKSLDFKANSFNVDVYTFVK